MEKDQLSFFDENNFENGKKLIVSIDKVYIAAVLVVLLLVVAFSLGVERGKKIAQRHDSYDIIKQATTSVQLAENDGNATMNATSVNGTDSESEIPVSVEDARALADQTQATLATQVAEEEEAAAQNVVIDEKNAAAKKALKKADAQKADAKKVDAKKSDKKTEKTADTNASKVSQPKSVAPYTIQIASFGKRSAAQAVAERIEKKGFKTSIVRKGSFYILTVGEFKTKTEARKVIASLKSNYHDCFIRNR